MPSTTPRSGSRSPQACSTCAGRSRSILEWPRKKSIRCATCSAEQIARILRADVTVELGRTREIARQPGARGGQVHALALERETD